MAADFQPPALEALIASRPKPVPRRYPAIGFGLVGSFVIACVVLTAMRGTAAISSLMQSAGEVSGGSELKFKSLSPEVQLAFVRVGRQVRKISCLAAAMPEPSDVCKAAVETAAAKISKELASDLREASLDASSLKLRALLVEARVVATSAQNAVVQMREGQGQPNVAALAAQRKLGQRATTVGEHFLAVVNLDDPIWEASDDDTAAVAKGAAPPIAAAAVVPVERPVILAAAAAAGAVAPAAAPAPEAVKAASPPPAHALPTEAPPREPVPAVAAAPVPVAAAPVATPSAASPADTKEVAKGLMKTLQEVLGILDKSGHDVTLVADAVWRSRRRLESMDTTLHEYRTARRPPSTEADAKAFSEQVDKARGKLQRAASELDRTKLVAIGGMEGESPFKGADDALAKAKDDVAAAEALVGKAP